MLIRVFTFALFLLSSFSAAYGQIFPNVCPELKVIGPAGLTAVNEPMKFTLDITGGKVRNSLEYEWTVSAGEIVRGKGTAELEVKHSVGGSNVTAAVTVKGLPPGCESTASEVSSVEQELPWCAADEWGNIRPNDIRGRLDMVFTELTNNPDNHAYLLLHETGDSQSDLWRRRIKFIVKHADFRKFDATRIIFLGCDGEGPRTTYFRGPAGEQARFSSNCRVIGLSEF